MTTPRSVLEAAYFRATDTAGKTEGISSEQQVWLETITAHADTQKAVIAALMTSLVKKILAPEQDVRFHQVGLPGGYSGRIFDTSHVTPFIREHFARLAMKSGSGWLTRSIEQNHAFTQDFPGRIQNAAVKSAFLAVLHDIEVNKADPEPFLVALLAHLEEQTRLVEQFIIPGLQRGKLTIEDIVELLRQHFFHNYRVAGASRLPVLAIYAVYKHLMDARQQRFEGKSLSLLKSHTTSDTKSRSYGDIEILDTSGQLFEAVEVKHGIPISLTLITDAFEKIVSTPAERYYLLTTSEPNTTDYDAVQAIVRRVRQEHGCEMIVNGILPSLKYYLRLLPEPQAFLETYTAVLKADFEQSTDIKQVHLQRWADLLSQATTRDATSVEQDE